MHILKPRRRNSTIYAPCGVGGYNHHDIGGEVEWRPPLLYRANPNHLKIIHSRRNVLFYRKIKKQKKLLIFSCMPFAKMGLGK